MATLAQELGESTHYSVLARRARRFGLSTTGDLIRLAVARGCFHYAPGFPPAEDDPGLDNVSNEELVTLLLLGSNEYEPIAVRCAAQLAGDCDVEALSHLAKQERVGRSLAYIARAGALYDIGHKVWNDLLGRLGPQDPPKEGVLPHWSRFVLQTGVTRSGGGSVQWLRTKR